MSNNLPNGRGNATSAPVDSVRSTTEAFTILIGFSLYLTCGILGSTSFPFINLPSYILADSLPLSTIGTAGRLLVLAIAALLSLKFDLLQSKITVLAISSSYALGMLLTYSPEWMGFESEILLIIGEILRATHIALFVLWAEVLCRHDGKLTLLITAGGYCISYAIKAVLLDLSTETIVATLIILPILSGGVLSIFAGTDKSAGNGSLCEVAKRPLWKAVRSLPLKQYLGIGIFGLALPLATRAVGSSALGEGRQLTSLALVVVVGLFMFLMLRVPDSKRDVMVYRLTMPIIVAAILVIYAADTYGVVEAIVLEGTWVLYRTMATVAWCVFARRSGLPIGFALAASQIVLTICLALASPIGKLASAAFVAPVIIIGVAIVVTALASAFLLGENDYRDPEAQAAAAIEDSKELVERRAKECGISQQEQRVCELIVEGLPSEKIREELCIAQSTLKVHLRNIYSKTGVHSRNELVEYFRSR